MDKFDRSLNKVKMNKVSSLKERRQVQIVWDSASEHLHARVPVDDLRGRYYELLIFEQLVQEPYARNLPVSNSANVVNQYPFLAIYTTHCTSLFLLKEFTLVGWETGCTR